MSNYPDGVSGSSQHFLGADDRKCGECRSFHPAPDASRLGEWYGWCDRIRVFAEMEGCCSSFESW